ncbi:MAG: hypothetical protein ABIG44_16670 [Planctomycetota bacterium]
MHARSTSLLATVSLALILLAGCATTPKEPLLTPAQHDLNLESFEQVWSTVNDNYWDPNLGGIDWQAIHDELRPEMEQTRTMSAARDVIRDMIYRLELSHFGIFPAELYKDLDNPERETPMEGSAGIDLRVMDGHALVTAVDPGSRRAWNGTWLCAVPLSTRLLIGGNCTNRPSASVSKPSPISPVTRSSLPQLKAIRKHAFTARPHTCWLKPK